MSVADLKAMADAYRAQGGHVAKIPETTEAPRIRSRALVGRVRKQHEDLAVEMRDVTVLQILEDARVPLSVARVRALLGLAETGNAWRLVHRSLCRLTQRGFARMTDARGLTFQIVPVDKEPSRGKDAGA